MNYSIFIFYLQQQSDGPEEITLFTLLCPVIVILIFIAAIWLTAISSKKTNYIKSNANLQLAQAYIKFCNDANSTAEGLREFYSDKLVWQEMPHTFAPTGRTLDFAGMQAAFTTGQKLMAEQRYILDNVVASDEAAALQISWRMTLAQPLGDLAVGTRLSGKLAIFIHIKNGKIMRQTDYLSYDPMV